MTIDLHIHTFYSDGKFSPQEVISGAAQAGVRVMAVTDHDNTTGAREAAPLALAAGIELVPGIEITTRWVEARLPRGDANVDLLGYCFDLENPEFRAFQEASLNDIHARIAACCAWLTAQGYPIDIQNVFAENPRYAGLMQLIHALLHKNLAASWPEAVQLAERAWLSGRDTPFTIQSAIQQIHLAGGAAVLAHPSIVRPEGKQLSKEWLGQLVQAGLDGIEVYHHRLDEEARAHFLGLANSFGLIVTGGSDMHGWHRGMSDLGTQPVTAQTVEALKSRAAAYRRPLEA